jgi:hypothetical protein
MPAVPARSPEDPVAPSPLATIRAVRDVETSPRRRIDPSSPAILVVAVSAVIALVAMAVAVAAVQPGSPVNGRAAAFVRPFDYQVPAGSDIRLYASADRLNVLMSSPLGSKGISIWAVEDVLADRCSNEGGTTARPPAAAGLLSYLRSVDRLRVDREAPVAVDGRPATRVDLTVEAGESGCLDHAIHLWNAGPPNMVGIQIPDDRRVRLFICDVDEATIVLEVWSYPPVSFDEWLPTAEGIIDSIRFIYRPPAGTLVPDPSRSP